MNGPREGGYETISIGALLIVFAVSALVAWTTDDWWLFIPVFLLGAGSFYIALGAIMRPAEGVKRAARMNSPYYIFWGATLFIIGAMWLLNRQYPGNFPLLAIVFIIWVGVFILGLSLRRSRSAA